jgi:hypothetical protein
LVDVVVRDYQPALFTWEGAVNGGNMTRKPYLTCLGALIVLLGPSDGWTVDPHAVFPGLWQGVDQVDGSLRTISVTDVDDDGVFEVRAHDTHREMCEGGRAIESGTGTIDEEGVLRTEGTIRCDSGDETPVDLTYSAQGSAPFGLLLEEAVGTPFAALLHRVSQR